MDLPGFAGFVERDFDVDAIRIHARIGGDPAAPPLLLIHGFPQSHVMWHRVAGPLARRHRVVCPDLRGYGDSSKPAGSADHANYSKRAMAADLVDVMRALGHRRFAVVGHDRGRAGRAPAGDRSCGRRRAALRRRHRADADDVRAHRLRVRAGLLALVLPHPAGAAARDDAGSGCTAAAAGVPRRVGRRGPVDPRTPGRLAEYERCWATPEGLHASCEDYRASAGIDLDHDRASDAAGERVRCPLLALWGENGVVGRLFAPLEDWRAKCDATVIGHALPAGHFIPEEVPDRLLVALQPFLAAAPSAP